MEMKITDKQKKAYDQGWLDSMKPDQSRRPRSCPYEYDHDQSMYWYRGVNARIEADDMKSTR
jgi:hypothetical protein